MIEKDDWRLLNDVEHLKNKAINPTDGEDITQYAKHLKKCMFCCEKVQDTPHQWWFIPKDSFYLGICMVGVFRSARQKIF